MITRHSKRHFFRIEEPSRTEMLQRVCDWSKNPIGVITLYRTYLRKKSNGQLETWNECVIRVIEGMFSFQKTHVLNSGLPWYEDKAQRTALDAAERLFLLKWTPPGRGLWMMGTEFVWDKGGAALNNCAFTSTKHIDKEFSEPFRFLMDMSMLGVGVGFDTEGAGRVKVNKPVGEPEVYVVSDDREGWVKAIGRVIDSYLIEGSPPVEADTSLVRPFGAAIRGFGGVASGPRPLINGFNGVKSILDQHVGRPITSVGITDIMNIIGKTVVAGNVRRTAEIAFGHPEDVDFRRMKSWDVSPVAVGVAAPGELKDECPADYDAYMADMYGPVGDSIIEKYQDRPWAFKFRGWRWASNNSNFAEVGMDYTEISESIAENGEPGLAWLENMRNYSRMNGIPDYKDIRVAGGNPCLEQSLEDKELCCLVETFPSRNEDAADFYKTIKIAYLYAKTVTLIATHNTDTNKVICRNRRIGTSQSGITDAIARFSRYYYQEEMLNKAYDHVCHYDDVYSEWLGVPRSIKKTSVKPSGSVSLLAGVSPGIHYPKVKYGYRTMRIAKGSELIPILRKAKYRIEPSIADPARTLVIYFPIINTDDTETESDVTIWEQFTNAVMLQKWWADNQVSITISFKAREKKDIAKCLSTFDSELKGVSLLPLHDHGYKQAPYIHADKAEVTEYSNSLLPLDMAMLHQISEGDDAGSNKFCDGDVCSI